MTDVEYAAIQQELLRDEGLSLTVYTDPLGVPTIGCGRNLRDRGLTHGEAMTLLANDIRATEIGLRVAYPWYLGLSATRRRVLLNVAFNCGLRGFASFRRMHAALAKGDYGLAADELLDSQAARQLPTRYQRLATSLRTDV